MNARAYELWNCTEEVEEWIVDQIDDSGSIDISVTGDLRCKMRLSWTLNDSGMLKKSPLLLMTIVYLCGTASQTNRNSCPTREYIPKRTKNSSFAHWDIISRLRGGYFPAVFSRRRTVLTLVLTTITNTMPPTPWREENPHRLSSSS